MDRGIWNPPYPDPQLRLDIVAAGGVNQLPYFDDTSLRSNNLSSSNLSVEFPNHMAANTGTSQNPYMHASSASSSNVTPPDYVQTAGHGAVISQMDHGRAQYKRKNPALSMAIDRRSTSFHYSTASSSNFSVPSPNLQSNPTRGPQYWVRDPVSMPLSHRSNNLLTAAEGSHRNVRSRQSHAIRLENNPTGAHPSGNLSHHQPSTNLSGFAVGGHWSQAPASLDLNRRVLSSGPGFFNHETNQFFAGSGSASHNTEIGMGYAPNPLHARSMTSPLPTLPSLRPQVIGVGHNGYGQRTTPYSAISSYQPVGFAANLEHGRRVGLEAIPPSRHSRPVAIIGRSNGRSRNMYDRVQTFSDGEGSRSRWFSEGASPVDRSTIFDSRNFFDQHRNMRLDIDNMSYEEMLALEERIGSVNTGLSENTISTCLAESVYCSSNPVHEEGNCVVCLEEYKDRDILGRLNCGHDFHSSCIKKWLLIKNACPICKGAALPDSLKEK